MNEFTLIDGVFTPAEAKDVLLNLIEYKIQFHHRKNFSSEEKYGVKDQHSLKRLQELQSVKDRIKTLLESPDKQDMHISVTSLITINAVLHDVQGA